MKQSPQMDRLEEMLRSSKLVRGGFLGRDRRSLAEIIDADIVEVSKLKTNVAKIAARMRDITDIAKAGLGTWVKVCSKRHAMIQEAKGLLVCPWPHPGRFAKRVTTVKLIESDEMICWADLNIHLISEHNFFEGKGSEFRIDPEKLIKIIF